MSHPVKCYYCGKTFDRDKELDWVQIGRRYAHKLCAENKDLFVAPKDKDLNQLEGYVKQLTKMTYVHPNIQKQIKEYVENLGFTYSGIYKTLFYYFDIMHNTKAIMMANPTIAIVPYVYPNAKEYYYRLHNAVELNKGKTFEKPKEVTVTIRAPEREPLRKRNLFTFLDEEEVEK